TYASCWRKVPAAVFTVCLVTCGVKRVKLYVTISAVSSTGHIEPYESVQGSNSIFHLLAFIPGSVLNHRFASSTDEVFKTKIPPPPSNGPAANNFFSSASLVMLARWPSINVFNSSADRLSLFSFLFRKTNMYFSCATAGTVNKIHNRMRMLLCIALALSTVLKIQFFNRAR